MKIVFSVLIVFTMLSCVPMAVLTSQGSRTAAMRSDTAQALPGKPFEGCKTVTVLTSEYSYNCRGVEDLCTELRNMAGALGSNMVLIAEFIDPGHSCYHQAQGVALLCEEATLRAVGITQQNMTPGIIPAGMVQSIFGR